MEEIRIKDLPGEGSPNGGDFAVIDSGSEGCRKATLHDIVTAVAGALYASAAQGAKADSAIQPDDFGSVGALIAAAETAAAVLAVLGVGTTGAAVFGADDAATARGALELGDSAIRDLIGTVGQSGGVPTGAIIERGSNANGEYVRYADGTQICLVPSTGVGTIETTVGSIKASASAVTIVLPAAFISDDYGVYACDRASHGIWVSAAPVNTGEVAVRAYSYGSFATNRTVHTVAIGRWF
ncbi:hypothetical protein [Oricola thermophila]|uniref:Uncharacterized protein n=1 Tax=Oricola thermophila TaxID=2742145 RepID=A0A6N1VH42_9HYPH|nr:hypothetical protein [Oricola thermophila]QKV20231.1 hypothetical protein HTY61_18130 [Oricola thermophila]